MCVPGTVGAGSSYPFVSVTPDECQPGPAPPVGPLTHLLQEESNYAEMYPVFTFIKGTLYPDWLMTCFGQEKATEGTLCQPKPGYHWASCVSPALSCEQAEAS